MKLLHTMVRVSDLDASLHFYCDLLGFKEVRRHEVPEGKFTLIFLKADEGEHEIELTHNWGSTEKYSDGRNFGHLAIQVENIYESCQKLMDAGVTINRPPRCGHMAFVRSPDGISIELLQDGKLAPQEPWVSMENTGVW
ncbi:VOC family protein [Thalassotalea atypica]|uniref:VOC family protein n=1 Tax=Thalassotalea atypica TaxID=2054316 RepID=UPI002573886E|nr:VOC family protein [Thalassotalea atypica]